SEAENIPSIRSAIGRSLRGLRGIRRRGGRVIPKRGWNSANGLYRGIAPVASGSFPGGRIDRSSELVQFSLDVEQSQARRVLRQNSGAAGHSR
ncbi:hypothetical protein EBT16_07750, partial [bacterium]|nr:hypothetical protein [bacterium]